MRLIQLMKEYKVLMNFISICYNIFYYNNSWKYKLTNRLIFKGAFLKKVQFNIKGKNNIIIVGEKARLNACYITIIGDNCKIEVGGGSTIISNTSFWCQDNQSSISIGKDFTMEGGHIASTENQSITIGNDCMFSGGIEIRNGDSHSIIDNETKKRINPAESVLIGNHVWLTAHVRVLKGVKIPQNSIIGNSSLVSKRLELENALYGGIPCKLIKENINWVRNKL